MSVSKFELYGAWGLLTSVDIRECNPEIIRDAVMIKDFVIGLCSLIDMKRFGETQVVHFGEDARVAGFSMVQLIETSLISAHFVNATNTVYLDIFSCKAYDADGAAKYALEFFRGKDYGVHTLLRR